MNALSILDKFDTIDSTNNNRLPQEDIAFCEAQQKLYTQVMAHQRHIFEALCRIHDDNEVFMKSIAAENVQSKGAEYTCAYYTCNAIKLTKDDFITKHFEPIHCRFVSTIIQYFTQRYHVSLAEPAYKALLQLVKPESPSRDNYFSKATDAEIAAHKAAQQEYDKKYDAYLDSICSCELDYNTILDHIFVELGGNSFGECAEREIISGSRSASKGYRGNLVYEIKNKKVTFSILSPRKGWNNQYNVSLNGDNYLALLRALTYFDSNKQHSSIYDGWNQFIDYSKYEADGIFDSHDVYGAKIASFKYYKNGKFEVTFDSHTSAAAFANTYLAMEGVSDNAQF